MAVADRHFRRRLASGAQVEPRTGRFYPRGLLASVGSHFAEDRRPFFSCWAVRTAETWHICRL